MSDTLATIPSRKQAVEAVRSTRCPQGVSRTQWRSMKRVLMVVAQHYPKSHPSVATIADRARLSVAQTRRVLRLAEAAGLLVTEFNQGVGRGPINNTSRYYIASLNPDAPESQEEPPVYRKTVIAPLISGQEMSDEGTPSESLLPSEVGTHSGSPRYARPQSAAMSREAERIVREGEARVVRERGRLRTERPVFQTKTRKNDARLLREYFQLEWENLLAKKPLLASNNALDRTGEVEGYIWHQFLRPEYGVSYDGNQVMEMMDAFFLDLASGRVGLKPRQSAWKAFTVYKQPPKIKTTREKGSLRARNK